MKKKKARRSRVAGGNQEECCALCRLADDDPAVFGEKVTLKEHKLSVHYFCLLTSCGVYQRGEEDEGVFGFLVDDIKQEIRRSARLTCCYCKKKGACVGCNVRSCRKTVHFPCGRKYEFISQFTEPFPSYCRDHSPSQSVSVGPDLSLPQSCSVCLDSIEPVLCYSVLKCPSCHNSWFHRDCVQRQAHSAGLFFFRCTLCNNKENFQEEMLRMGIFIPERDASWELEAEAYAELLVVYRRCDALTCLCNDGRTHSAKSGWFEVIRCRLCGSRGTHRKCSGLESDTRDWACSDCTQAADGRASLVSSPQRGQRRSLLSKRHPSPIHSPVSCKRQSEHCVVHCLLCEKPQDELLTHLARVCMKTSTPEERRAELQRAQQSVKEWTREARNWDYADMCLWIPHTPSRLALLEDLRRRNFFVANVPDSAHLDPGDERVLPPLGGGADKSPRSGCSSGDDAGSNSPTWKEHLAQSNTTVMFNMQNMGLYKKFPPEATVLTGFQSFIVHIPNCQQQVDNASRMLRYLQPSGSDVSMDFLVRSAETQDFLDKLKEAHMAPATVLNYIKSMIRFVLYLKTRLEFAAEDPDFDRKCEAYLNLLKALKKPVVKAHGAWKTRSDVLLQGGRSLQSCQRLLHEAKNDMRAIYRTLLQKQHVSPEEKLLFRYYCVAIVILQHFQKPGALEGMTVTEWLSRKTVAGRVCVTFSQQGVSFALSQEEAAMLEQYFLSVRPDYIYTNAEDDGTFFLASRGRPLKGTTNDLSRLHAHYKLPNVTSQEIRRVVKAVVAASCTEEQKFAVDLYMGRSAALNRAPSRTRTLDSTVTTSALLSSLGRYEPSPESPSVHLPLTCEGSAEERSPRAHKRTREEEEEEDGRGRRHWEAFLQRFPVTLSGQQRADAGFPSHFYDKWRNLQFCQRREYLQSKYSSRCPTVEEVAKEISEQGWTANHPHPEDVVSKWRAAEKTPGESERGAIGGETGWKLASRTFVGSRGQRRRRRPARTFKPSQVIVISSVTQVSLEDTG